MTEGTCHVNHFEFLISGNDVISLKSRPLNPATADVFPVVANTKSIQKRVKSIDVYRVGSKKPSASKSCFVSSLETQGQLVGTIEYSW